MKKLLLTISIITTLLFTQGITLAADSAVTEPSDSTGTQSEAVGVQSSDFTFNVTENLRVDDPEDPNGMQNQTFFQTGENGSSPFENFIIRVINILISVIGSVALLLIVIAGIMMITSPGNENQLSKAKEILMASIIGLILAFSSFIIVNFVQGLFY